MGWGIVADGRDSGLNGGQTLNEPFITLTHALEDEKVWTF